MTGVEPTVEQLIEGLRNLSRTIESSTELREQIILRLKALHGLSLRQIASPAGLNYSTVRNVLRRVQPNEDLILPYPESPHELVVRLKSTYWKLGPVTRQELTAMRDEHEQLYRHPIDRMPPYREWTHLGIERLLAHAQNHPATVLPEEAAAQYRMVTGSGCWRVQHWGVDTVSETRQRWLTFIGRIAAHAGP